MKTHDRCDPLQLHTTDSAMICLDYGVEFAYAHMSASGVRKPLFCLECSGLSQRQPNVTPTSATTAIAILYHVTRFSLWPPSSRHPPGPVWNGLPQKVDHVMTLSRFQAGPDLGISLRPSDWRQSAFCSRPSLQPSFFSIRRELSKSHGFTEAESRWKGCVGSCDIRESASVCIDRHFIPLRLQQNFPLSLHLSAASHGRRLTLQPQVRTFRISNEGPIEQVCR